MASSSYLWYSQVCYMALALCMLLNTVTVANSVNSSAINCRKHSVKYSEINCRKHSVKYSAINCRKHSALLTDFNAKGDGKTLNTGAFEAAIAHLSKLAEDGGAQLIVPPGKYLTGTINLISSHFTLFLHQHAEIIASSNEKDFPVLPPLPSYGPLYSDGRHSSLILGINLTDIVITGANGTLNGQGAIWWEKFRKGEIKYSRPSLIEIVSSDHVQISHLTFINSPNWNVHPVYSRNVIIQGLTITAPVDSANTDGINPDSCSNVLIQENYIVSGDNCIAIKSGLNEYGIRAGIPSQHIIIKRLTCISPSGAGIAIGSEMSGGIQDVRAMDLNMINTESCVRIKTGTARGNYVKDIFVRNVVMKTMKYVFWMTGSYDSQTGGDHAHPSSIPVVQGINYKDMVAENVTKSASLAGIQGYDFKDICISNVTIGLARNAKKVQWDCSDVAGVTSKVKPRPCSLLPQKRIRRSGCPFPMDRLPIEYTLLQKCTA